MSAATTKMNVSMMIGFYICHNHDCISQDNQKNAPSWRHAMKQIETLHSKWFIISAGWIFSSLPNKKTFSL